MYAFCLGPVGPTDKENQVKMYKKDCFRYITSLKWKGFGSVSKGSGSVTLIVASVAQDVLGNREVQLFHHTNNTVLTNVVSDTCLFLII